MSEFNSSSFLLELDSFGKPPPQKTLGAIQTKEIAQKLDAINMDKQKKMRSDVIVPSQQGMVQLGSGYQPKRQQIDPQDAQKWRSDVLALSRPRPLNAMHSETTESARQYAREIAPTVNSSINVFAHSDSDDDRGTRSSSSSGNSLPSPPSEVMSPYLKVNTHHERKSSDYSSASSQKSPSPPSQYSDYASLYKSSTVSPNEISPQRVDSPTKTFNNAFRNSVPVVSVSTAGRFSTATQPSSQPKIVPISHGNIRPGTGPNIGYGPSLTQQIRVVDRKPPAGPQGKAPGFRSVSDTVREQKLREISAANEDTDARLKDLSKKLHEHLVMEQKHIVGSCAHCTRPMYDTEDRYTVNDKMYHSRCFSCEVCGRELKDQQFYLNDGRFFCKQHFFHDQLVPEKKIPKCYACQLPLESAVLSALGRKFHPRCFRCVDCGNCLDGVPFSVDKQQMTYCMPCFHDRFAPRCTTCRKPITPDPESGETVRIVALENSYHVECYVCEGCNVAFNDDEGVRCYPLGRHLLCENCHRAWSRQSITEAPITDL